MRGGGGEAWGGGVGQTKEQCGSNKRVSGPLKNLTIGLIWLVTRGGWGGGVAREAGKGEMGWERNCSNQGCAGSLQKPNKLV